MDKSQFLSKARELSRRYPWDEKTALFFRPHLSNQDQNERGKPRRYIEFVLALLHMFEPKTIVEIGSMRQPMNHPFETDDHECCNDGHSTMFWLKTGLNVHSVDNDLAAYELTLRACQGYPKASVYLEDGIEFLKRFDRPIDLLFLDSWDVAPSTDYAEKHYEAWCAARRKMSSISIVAIDDTDVDFGGKGRLVIPAAIRDGYEPLIMARQTILVRQRSRRLHSILARLLARLLSSPFRPCRSAPLP